MCSPHFFPEQSSWAGWSHPQRVLFPSKPLCWLSSAAVTKHHTLGGLMAEFIFPQTWKLGNPRSGDQQGWFLLRPFSLAGRWPPSCCVLTWSYLVYACPWCLSGSKSPFLRRLWSYWIRAHPYGLSLLNHLLTGPISKYGHILRAWGLGLQSTNADTSQPITTKC